MSGHSKKLPKRIMGMGGPIEVLIVDPAKDPDFKPEPHPVKNDVPWGVWVPETRTIKIVSNVSRAFQWATFYHELGHAVLQDTGLAEQLTSECEEALCVAFSSARMMELQPISSCPS
jgi:hypothetical protein